MVNSVSVVCKSCCSRIPKYQCKLKCSMCYETKHYKCEKLSKSDVESIISIKHYNWTCYECISSILPVNATSRRKKSSQPNPKIQCNACKGFSYSAASTRTCPWCDAVCHKKCIKNELGCINCCNDMIPGYQYHAYELLDISSWANNAIFNPYFGDNNVNNIGDRMSNEEENNEVWSELSELMVQCRYKMAKNIPQTKDNELGVLSLNIRSVHKNLDKILDKNSDYDKYDVICLNETCTNVEKLANGLNDLLIEGFHPPVHQAPARQSHRGGGLLIYVNKRICEEDDIEGIDLEQDPTTDGEVLFIKIKSCKKFSNTVLIGNVYRSPSSPNTHNFNSIIENTLNKLGRHKTKQILIAGDFNIDLIKYETDENSRDIIDITSNHGFSQVISRPTRITDHSATLIDHIYTNKVNKVLSSCVVTLDVSDHLGTFIKVSLDNSFDRATRPINRRTDSEVCEYRLFNEANNDKFKELLDNEPWDELNELDNADNKYNKFVEIYTKHYDTAYPLISRRVRRKNERVLPKPWITEWLEDACNRKNLLYYEFVENPNEQNKNKYDKMCKFCEKHIAIAKKKYYKKYFDEHVDNSRKKWQMINKLLNRKKGKVQINKLVDSSGKTITKPEEISDKFNDYFSNIASNLKTKIETPASSDDYKHYLKHPVPNSIVTLNILNHEVKDIIRNFKNKTTRDTKISVLKLAAENDNFIKALTKTIEASFDQGIFPESLKIAQVVPIHKEGSKTDVSNYRPISLLATFSKIYEKLMHHRLITFLGKNNSLHELQYGFRAGRSCEHALLTAQNSLLHSLNKNKISLLLLIDFSKAFDMVDHNILLYKLQHYGIRGKTLKWLKSYLHERKQYVSINGTNSSSRSITYGIPQGSILGPLLFIIYINDIPEVDKLAKFILYADDANIIVTGNNMLEIEEKIAQLNIKLVRWVNSNGLMLNLKKTHFMIFSRQKIEQNPIIKINNFPIKRVHEARFLGVIVDDKLTWSAHIRALKSKMSRYIGIMYKIKSKIPVNIRLQIYHSFVQSHLNFCSLVWGFSNRSNIEMLFRMQKKAMRAVMPGYVNYFYKDGQLPTATKQWFNQYSVLTIHGIIANNTLNFMHKSKSFSSLLPLSVKNTIPDSIINMSMIDQSDPVFLSWLAEFNTHVYRKSIFFKGPLLYFDPSTVQKYASLASYISFNIFKSQSKRFLFGLQSEGVEDDWKTNTFLIFDIKCIRTSRHVDNNIDYKEYF